MLENVRFRWASPAGIGHLRTVEAGRLTVGYEGLHTPCGKGWGVLAVQTAPVEPTGKKRQWVA
jgi:hypothetical protein